MLDPAILALFLQLQYLRILRPFKSIESVIYYLKVYVVVFDLFTRYILLSCILEVQTIIRCIKNM